MASSRDDFIIAIRSAFLKKETKQKFSLLTLFFISILIIFLSSFNFKVINNLINVINEIVYRSSFIISVPENFAVNSYVKIIEYANFYKEYKLNLLELKDLKSKEILNEIIISENKELKNLIEDFTLTTSKILSKVIVDHDSPFLKTIIINKGSRDGLKIGTNVFDKNYLIGRVIETNFKTARVLLLSDLNSSVPISITPGNIQAIVTGDGENSGERNDLDSGGQVQPMSPSGKRKLPPVKSTTSSPTAKMTNKSGSKKPQVKKLDLNGIYTEIQTSHDTVKSDDLVLHIENGLVMTY